VPLNAVVIGSGDWLGSMVMCLQSLGRSLTNKSFAVQRKKLKHSLCGFRIACHTVTDTSVNIPSKIKLDALR